MEDYEKNLLVVGYGKTQETKSTTTNNNIKNQDSQQDQINQEAAKSDLQKSITTGEKIISGDISHSEAIAIQSGIGSNYKEKAKENVESAKEKLNIINQIKQVESSYKNAGVAIPKETKAQLDQMKEIAYGKASPFLTLIPSKSGVTIKADTYNYLRYAPNDENTLLKLGIPKSQIDNTKRNIYDVLSARRENLNIIRQQREQLANRERALNNLKDFKVYDDYGNLAGYNLREAITAGKIKDIKNAGFSQKDIDIAHQMAIGLTPAMVSEMYQQPKTSKYSQEMSLDKYIANRLSDASIERSRVDFSNISTYMARNSTPEMQKQYQNWKKEQDAIAQYTKDYKSQYGEGKFAQTVSATVAGTNIGIFPLPAFEKVIQPGGKWSDVNAGDWWLTGASVASVALPITYSGIRNVLSARNVLKGTFPTKAPGIRTLQKFEITPSTTKEFQNPALLKRTIDVSKPIKMKTDIPYVQESPVSKQWLQGTTELIIPQERGGFGISKPSTTPYMPRSGFSATHSPSTATMTVDQLLKELGIGYSPAARQTVKSFVIPIPKFNPVEPLIVPQTTPIPSTNPFFITTPIAPTPLLPSAAPISTPQPSITTTTFYPIIPAKLPSTQNRPIPVSEKIIVPTPVQVPTPTLVSSPVSYTVVTPIEIVSEDSSNKRMPPIPPLLLPDSESSEFDRGIKKINKRPRFLEYTFKIPKLQVYLPTIDENFEDTPFGKKAVRTVTRSKRLKAGAKQLNNKPMSIIRNDSGISAYVG